MNLRLIIPNPVSQQSMTVNGRLYSGTPGSVIDVPDCDGTILGASGWIIVAPSGPTASRPSTRVDATPPYLAGPGTQFFDTTLDKLVIFDGYAWRDPATGAAV